MSTDARPLAGVRILDLTRLLPGPACTLHLADLGADVIKVEDPCGDPARSLGGAALDGASALFRMLNRNKRGIALDLKTSAARAAFLRLAADSAVLVEGFRPGVADALGIGYQTVSACNPRIVYCSITGYGQTGPLRDRAGHDINYLARTGVLHGIGVAGGDPAIPNLQIADLLGGTLNAAMAILAALYRVERTGAGTHLDVAMTDGVLAHNLVALATLEHAAQAPARGDGMLTGGMPCYRVYRTRDGSHLAVGALETKFWRRLCAALARPDLVDVQFARGDDGRRAMRELESIFAGRTRDEWMHALEAVDCCVSPVLSLDEALVDAHAAARGMVRIDAAGARQYAPPFRASSWPFSLDRPAPLLGEHSREVLAASAFSAADIEALVASGAVVAPVRSPPGAA